MVPLSSSEPNNPAGSGSQNSNSVRMERFESMNKEEIVKFLQVFRAVECAGCADVMAFQHKTTGAMYCAGLNSSDGSPKHVTCYLTSSALSGIPMGNAGCAENVLRSTLSYPSVPAGVPTEAMKESAIPKNPLLYASPSKIVTNAVTGPSADGITRVKMLTDKEGNGNIVPKLVTPNASASSCSVDIVDSGPLKPKATGSVKVDQPSLKVAKDVAATPAPLNGINTSPKVMWADCVFSPKLTRNAQVKVSYSWNPSKLLISAVADEISVQNLQDMLMDYAVRTKALSSMPVVGQIVVAKYLEEYYRGRVLKMKGDDCAIEFVDFGDRGVSKYSQIFPVDAEIMKYPIFGMTVQLEGLPLDPPKELTFTGELEDTVFANSFILEFCNDVGRPTPTTPKDIVVRLLDQNGGLSLNETILHALWPDAAAPAQPKPKIADVPKASRPDVAMWSQCKFSPELVQNALVFVQFPYSSTVYHIVAEKDNEVLTKFQEQVLDAYAKKAKPLTQPPKRDQMVIADYEGQFYRGRVDNVDGDKCLVVFVDFGDKQTYSFSQLLPVDDTIMQYPVYGLMVRLRDVPEPPPGFSIGEELENAAAEVLCLDLRGYRGEVLKGPEEGLYEYEVYLWDSQRQKCINDLVKNAMKASG